MQIYDAIVIGAGPAGAMAAGRASERGLMVLLLEKNSSIGNKLLISGKGRCNITNACDSIDEFIGNFSPPGVFLKNAFFRFFNNELIDFFEERGLKLKTERGRRVFPVTDSSRDVVRVLEGYLKESKTHILFKKEVKDIDNDGGVFKAATADGSCFYGKQLVLATGGLSYPKTGSTGFGFYIAKRFGHTVIDTKPGLVGVCLDSKLAKKWQGVTLKNVRCSVFASSRALGSEFGEMIFTHFGVSGPIILDLSYKIYDALNIYKDVYISIDFKPALDIEKLDNRLLREFKMAPAKMLSSIFKRLLPSRLIPGFLDSIGIEGRKRANQISKQQRLGLVKALKDFRLSVSGTRPIAEAIVTRGGVSTKEINPKTMESRIVKGLYMVGELLDIDAKTGGYNMQAAFSTGYICGESL